MGTATMIKFLIYKEGKITGEYAHDAKSREITVGRAPGCTIRLDDPAVSRLHAIISFRDNHWVLEKKSGGGQLTVNGTDVQDAILLGGEEIAVDKFAVRVEMGAAGAAVGVDAPGGGLSADLAAAGAAVEGDRTRFASVSANALFRFEPGSASVAEFMMRGEVAVFGRASNCDVILTDKRASRKHLEIRRQGLAFFIKDLNSANGTLVNGKKITEAELVPGDVIEVGDNKCRFSIENKDYFEKQEEFLPVPAHLAADVEVQQDPAALVDPSLYDAPAYGGGAYDGAAVGGTQPGIAAPAAVEKSLFKRGWTWYKAQPPFRRYLVIFLVLALGVAFFGEEEVKRRKSSPPKRDAQGKLLRTYDNLSESRKKTVRQAYADLIAAHEKREFSKMLDSISKITALVDEYKDTKYFDQVAKKGIEEDAKEVEEKRQRERQMALAKAIQELEDKGRPIYEKALTTASARPELSKVIEEIYSKDPDNGRAREWKEGIKNKEAEEQKNRELAEQRRKLMESAEGEFKRVRGIFTAKKYVEAMAEADKLPELGYSENKYLDRVKAFKEEVRAALDAIINPLLQQASEQRKEGGDLVKANELYKKVLIEEPENKTALAGMESIRTELHTRAKRLYADAILAESISELLEARDKFAQCERTAPDEDVYKQRCRNKLAKYEIIK